MEGCLHTKWYVYLNDWYVFNIWKIGTSIEILNDFTFVFTSMIVWKWMRNNRNSEIGTLSQWKNWIVLGMLVNLGTRISLLYIYIGGFIYDICICIYLCLFMLIPIPGEMIQFDQVFFSNGLVQPPTSQGFLPNCRISRIFFSCVEGPLIFSPL